MNLDIDVAHLLTETVDIMRCTIVKSDVGERRTYEVAHPSVAAAVQPMTSREVSDFSRRGLDANTQVQINRSYGLTEKNFIRFNGRILEIVGIVNWQSADKLWTVYCRDKTPT